MSNPSTGRYSAEGWPPLIQNAPKPREVEKFEGSTGEEPEWLKAVLDIARLGGYVRGHSYYGFSDAFCTCFFIADEDHNLVEFT